MKKIFCQLLVIFTLSILSKADELSSLLHEIEQQNDLSKLTKKESVGHVSIFTRDDLNKLHIKSIKELLQYVRFLGYTENSFGLPDTKFSPYGEVDESSVKIYIDDQLLNFPFQGIGIQYFGQINLNFIDHVEIYWGIPSFHFSIDTAYAIVKLYTKEPARENANVLDLYAKTNQSSGVDGYSAHDFGDFSYLLSISKENIKRKELQKYANYPLKRDSYNNLIYSQFNVDNFTITFNGMKNSYDTFIGDTVTMRPTGGNIDIKYLYFALNYLSSKKDISAYLGYSISNTKTFQTGSPLGVTPLAQPYYSQTTKYKERLLNIILSKKFEFDSDIFEVGFSGRYKGFDKNIYEIDGYNLPRDQSYNKEKTSSFFAENTYLLNHKNSIITSLQYNHYSRNGDAKNDDALSARVGYVYNGYNFKSKAFIFYSQSPRTFYQFKNYKYFEDNVYKNEDVLAFSGEVDFKIDKIDLGLTYGHIITDKQLNRHKIKTDISSLTFEHKFDTLNRINGAFWLSMSDLGSYATNNQKEKLRQKGAYISLIDTIDNWDFANTITFYNSNNDKNRYYNLSTSISYHYSRNLQFYIKGTNLLNRAQEKIYSSVNLASTVEYTYFQAPLYDRAVMFGVEYLF